MTVEQVRANARGITQNVHITGPLDGSPVLLIHGNCSSGAYWYPLLRHLPAGLRVVAPDLRGYGATQPAPVDATRGLADFADDVAALLDVPELFPAGARPMVAGHSMGAGVAMRLVIERPERVAGLLLESPVSPYGFGGTRLDGTPCAPDFAGSGGGTANPDLVKLIAEGDTSDADPLSPRNIVRTLYFPGPDTVRHEDALLAAILRSRVGEGNYPGDAVESPHWPGTAPGTLGVLNALSAKYLDWSAFLDSGCQAPVLWVRGDLDAIVSDASFVDLGNLGALGHVPGWPGEEVF
ncbi:MAG: alpha/beta hydrolase, partial [Micromonosporaceae bacterium]